MRLSVSRVVGIYAFKQYGKTMLGAHLLRFMARHVKVMIYDTDGDFSSGRYSVQGAKILRPPIGKETDLVFLRKVIETLRANTSNAILYIVDLDRFFVGKTKGAEATLSDMISSGAHQRLGIWYESKYLKYIPLTILSGTDLLFFGQFSERDDIKRASSYATKPELLKLKKPMFLAYDRFDNIRYLVHFDATTQSIVIDAELGGLWDSALK